MPTGDPAIGDELPKSAGSSSSDSLSEPGEAEQAHNSETQQHYGRGPGDGGDDLLESRERDAIAVAGQPEDQVSPHVGEGPGRAGLRTGARHVPRLREQREGLGTPVAG